MYSKLAITLVIVGSALLAFFFKWQQQVPNLMGGDAKDYYSALVSVFIHHDLSQQSGNDWYLLHTANGTVNVHPVGVALLQLPFFLLALLVASFTDFAVDGFSFPFQLAIALAALVYASLGLNFLRKLLFLQGFQDRIIAAVLVLLYFGTNLMHYTVSEGGMSHVYSFALVSAFMFFSARLYQTRKNDDLLLTGLTLGLILLVRPNNIFVLPLAFIWCKSWQDFKTYLCSFFNRPAFWTAGLIAAVVPALQSLVWFLQSGTFFQNTYKRDGFYWLQPQVKEFLFGFDGGFFIYTPICLLFIMGLFFVFKTHRFLFVLVTGLFAALVYFFSSYWAYTYFDGFGIRVLVDYYGVMGLLAAHLFSALSSKIYLTASVSLLLLCINLVYTYQVNTGIILRTGMNFSMWKYVFLKTSPEYRNSLGGSHELRPYASTTPAVLDSASAAVETSFDFHNNEFGPTATSQSLTIGSRRLHAEVDISRREKFAGASNSALLVLNVSRPQTTTSLFYSQFPLNETPASTCCESRRYHYTCNLVGEFEKGDVVSVYIWNRMKTPFLLEKLALKLYNYNYDLN